MIEGIRHIIFDLGGVLLNLDYNLTGKAFRNLGISNFDGIYSQLKQNAFFDDWETGRLSREGFIKEIKANVEMDIADGLILNAWNAMLLDFPVRRLQLLQQLRLYHDLVLLSNTNEVHEEAFNAILFKEHSIPNIAVFFDKVYYSHRLGMRKPDREIFEKVLADCGFEAKHTLFIDDSPQHIESAKQLGIQTIYLEKGMTIEKDIFKPEE